MSDGIHLRTAQNVQIEYTPASLGDRILGYIIDSAVKICYIFILWAIFAAFISNGIISSNIWAWIMLVSFLPFLFYSFLFEYFFEGQTPGKRAVNIKVVSLDGESPTLAQYLMRWLFRIVDFSMTSGILAMVVIAAGGKGQRVGDLVAGTSVVTLKRRKTIYHTAYQKVAEDYTPVYAEAQSLSSFDIQTIKEVLGDRSENRFQLIVQLAEKVTNILHIEKNEGSESFLRNIVKDYNHFRNTED